MIKALYLENCPNMDSVSAIELLDELNPLITDPRGGNDGKTVITLSNGGTITRNSFITGNYFITFIKIEDNLTFESIKRIYEVMQLSVPHFLKVLEVGVSLIVAIPRYSDPYENACYSVMMEELVRFTAYCIRKTGDNIMSSFMLKEYVEMYVSYPGSKLNTESYGK